MKRISHVKKKFQKIIRGRSRLPAATSLSAQRLWKARRREEVAAARLEAQDAERRRIAHELHDEIGQQLTALRLLLGASGAASGQEGEERFHQARAIAADLLCRVRRFSFDLRPADLDRLGLMSALLSFFERFQAQTGILIHFEHRGIDGRFHPILETGAYRIVQESLTNCARHAGVTAVEVCLAAERDWLQVKIQDRGAGFDPLTASCFSGLAGIEERVSILGGRIAVESSPGCGTAVIAQLPVNQVQKRKHA